MFKSLAIGYGTATIFGIVGYVGGDLPVATWLLILWLGGAPLTLLLWTGSGSGLKPLKFYNREKPEFWGPRPSDVRS